MLYSHRGASPISRFAANRDPDSRSRPGRIGKRGFPVSRFRPSRELESGIPDVPVSRPNREWGERELQSELGISAGSAPARPAVGPGPPGMVASQS
jgi:hypothetical protein